MIKEKIQKLILQGTIKAFPNLPVVDVAIEITKERKFGDFSSAIALRIAKETGENPMEIAEKILQLVDDSDAIAKKEVAKPGFINFFLSERFLKEELLRVLKDGEKYGSSPEGENKTVVIDYSSPNIAKSFGVGHLRSTIIGQAIYNTYAFRGWNCIGDNHLGDWGTQFGKLIYQIKSKEIELSGLSIEKLEKLYVDFHKEAQENPELEEKGREWFQKLEEGDESAQKIWEYCVEVSLKEFNRIYELLGVKIDNAIGESFYSGMSGEVIKELKSKNIIKESKGALIVDFKESLPPLVAVKSDGATTYLIRDLAAIKFRIQKWNPDLFIYEVGADQSLYFRQLFETVEMLGWKAKSVFVHVAHGLVRWKRGKFSTRKGETIHLNDVLDEAIKKSGEAIDSNEIGKELSLEEKEKIARVIGIGAVKYNDLSQHYSRDIIFEWGKILNLKGNSGPYIQYAFARCKSVLRKAEFPIGNEIKIEIENYSTNGLEEGVLKELCKFPIIVESAEVRCSPNIIGGFLFELAQKYNLFYNSHRIINAEVEEARDFRLLLTAATAQVLENGLKLLGIEAPERM